MPLDDPKEAKIDADWAREVHNSFTFYPRAYPFKDIRPGWPEDYRARIEHDMAGLPDVPDEWLAVRTEIDNGGVAVWLEDRLIALSAYKSAAGNVGTTTISLTGGAQ